jgi:signal transduction histidine kinase
VRIAALIPLIGCGLNLFLALFVLWHGPKQVQNRVYFFLGICISIWNLGQYFNFTTPPTDPAAGLFWVRFVWLGVIFIPMLLFHLSMLTVDIKLGKLIPAIYIALGLLTLTLPTSFFVPGVRHLGSAGWYALQGTGLQLANLPFVLMFIAIIVLIKKRRKLPRVFAARLTPLIVAQTMLAVLGTNDTLPINGWDNYPGTRIAVYPYGTIAAVFYGVIVAYSLLQNQLLGARIALSKALAHVVRFGFLFIIATGLLLVASLFTDVFQREPSSMWIALGVFILSAVIAAVFFPRLFGGSGMEKWERRIMGDRFEYQDQVRNFMENMAWYTELDALFNDLHELLVRIFKLGSYQIILRDETSRAFALFRAHPDQPLRQIPELKVQSPVFRFFEWGKAAYLMLAPGSFRPTASTIEKQSREQLADFGGQFCFPLASQSEPFGLFIAGEKSDGNAYTATDINLLVTLMKNLSLMVNQIRLKNHILQQQELDLLGRMSRGMAHDLNNLLTPVWTLLQLSSEMANAGGPAQFDEELLPSALRNVKVMRAYIKEALFFSENLRPDFQLGRLDMIVKAAAEIAKMSRKKHIEIVTDTPEDVLVELDEVLVQRLIANLISNAIDASPDHSTIRVEIVRFPKSDASRDWLRVRVIDQGEGIRKEDLNRIFTPYFTTKTHGDENRGFGLGLAICRKIVNLHGGHVSISSQLKKGTTVELDLPSRQIKPQPPVMVQPA